MTVYLGNERKLLPVQPYIYAMQLFRSCYDAHPVGSTYVALGGNQSPMYLKMVPRLTAYPKAETFMTFTSHFPQMGMDFVHAATRYRKDRNVRDLIHSGTASNEASTFTAGIWTCTCT